METSPLRFILNGTPVEAVAGPDERLLSVLRDRLGLTDVTDGCSPQGQCGCCTVWVDGSPRVSCATPARRVEGREVVSPSGLPADLAGALGGAFRACGGSQCGFCSPGIVMRLAAMLRRSPAPGDAEIDRALAAHICRCTGWEQIRRACRRAGAVLRGERPPDELPAEALALGGRAYVDDRSPPHGLFVSPVLAPGPGRLRRPLSAPPGVELLPLSDRAAHDGVVLALLGGPDRPTVRRALERLEVHWEESAPPGDAGALFLSPSHPAFLEPESVVVDDVTVVTACERPARVAADHVVSVPDGGAFGGKREPWVEDLAITAARRLGRPVTLTLTREESIRCGPARHGARGMIRRDGGRLSGSLTFVAGERSLCRREVEDMARWCLPGPYRLQSDVVVALEETWGPPSGWMRGEGSLAAVALREAALGPGLAVRLELVTAGTAAAACLTELRDWLGGDDPAGVAVHVGRLPQMPGLWARWDDGVLEHPFRETADLSLPQRGTGELGLCPRGGGWPFVLVSLADGAEPGGPGPAVASAALTDHDGGIREVRVVVDAGRVVDPVMAEGHARGGAHMGLGSALSERVVGEAGKTRSLTIRSLGVVAAASTPPIHVRLQGDGPALAGVAEACVAPVGAAIMMAAGGRELPALETAAARRIRRQR